MIIVTVFTVLIFFISRFCFGESRKILMDL